MSNRAQPHTSRHDTSPIPSVFSPPCAFAVWLGSSCPSLFIAWSTSTKQESQPSRHHCVLLQHYQSCPFLQIPVCLTSTSDLSVTNKLHSQRVLSLECSSTSSVTSVGHRTSQLASLAMNIRAEGQARSYVKRTGATKAGSYASNPDMPLSYTTT